MEHSYDLSIPDSATNSREEQSKVRVLKKQSRGRGEEKQNHRAKYEYETEQRKRGGKAEPQRKEERVGTCLGLGSPCVGTTPSHARRPHMREQHGGRDASIGWLPGVTP